MRNDTEDSDEQSDTPEDSDQEEGYTPAESDQEEGSDPESEPGEVPDQLILSQDGFSGGLVHDEPEEVPERKRYNSPVGDILPPPEGGDESRASTIDHPPPWGFGIADPSEEEGPPVPKHASTPARPYNQPGSQHPSPARHLLDDVPEVSEEDEPETTATAPQEAGTPPPAETGFLAVPGPAGPPDVTSDGEIARQINAGERESQGMVSFAEARRTKSGRDTKPPDRLQAGDPRSQNPPRKKN